MWHRCLIIYSCQSKPVNASLGIKQRFSFYIFSYLSFVISCLSFSSILERSKRILWVMKELITVALLHTLSRIPRRVPFVINPSNYCQLCQYKDRVFKIECSSQGRHCSVFFTFAFSYSCLYSMFFFLIIFLLLFTPSHLLWHLICLF